ncbi:MAG: Uma2 family endonuclease [Isosphaeraceae bacterium]
MSTVDRPAPHSPAVPPLVEGQRLDRATFHERYLAMPPDVRAELVAGVVSMPSPLGYEHGALDSNVSDWLGLYRCSTPGLGKALNATTILGDRTEVQPDLLLRLPEALGGTSRIEGGYVVGPPELVVEVARTSRALDLGPKKDEYEQAGVSEYLFVGIDPDEVRWFARRDGRFTPLQAGPDGLLRSQVFPGLWLDPVTLLRGDLNALVAALDRGLASPEHAAFVARLNRPNDWHTSTRSQGLRGDAVTGAPASSPAVSAAGV